VVTVHKDIRGQSLELQECKLSPSNQKQKEHNISYAAKYINKYVVLVQPCNSRVVSFVCIPFKDDLDNCLNFPTILIAFSMELLQGKHCTDAIDSSDRFRGVSRFPQKPPYENVHALSN